MKISLNDVMLVLKYLFPNTAPPDYNLFQLEDDTQITSWSLQKMQPTELEIAQALPLATAYQNEVNISAKAIKAIEDISGFSKTQREFILAFSSDTGLKTKLAEHDAAIQLELTKLETKKAK